MQNLSLEHCESKIIKSLVNLTKFSKKSIESSKLSARIKLQLTCNSQQTEYGIIDHLYLSEYKDPKDSNTRPFEGKDLGIITYELFGNEKKDFELGAIRRCNYDEEIGMYLTHPDQVIKVWNEIVIVIKHFESMKRELNPSKTEFVSIRGTEYFGEMEKIIGILNKTPIFDRVFQDLTIYHSHDIVSQRCRDNGISYLNR